MTADITIRRPQNHIRDAEGEHIIELYYEGLEFKEIAARVNRTRQGVSQYLVRIGIHQPEKQEIDPRTIDGAIRWYECNVPVALILRQFKISEAAFYRHLSRRKVALRYPKMSEANRRRSKNYANGAAK